MTVAVSDSPLGPFRNPEKKPYFPEGASGTENGNCPNEYVILLGWGMLGAAAFDIILA